MTTTTSRPLIDVVKRRGARPTERFDPDKLAASIHAACLSVRSPEGNARDIAGRVTGLVIIWCGKKSEITSDDIRHQAAHALTTFHPDAAYFYQQHHHII